MKKWLAAIAVLFLAGCGGPAENVKDVDGSAPGIRLLKMSGGFIDEAGRSENAEVSQLNAWVEIDRQSGIAGYMGVTLYRVVSDPEIFRDHAPRYLGVAANDELRIRLSSGTVVLHAMEEGKRWHKNKVDAGGFRTTTYFEEVRYQASAVDLELLAKGPIIGISAAGKKGGTAWPRRDRKLLPEYQSRLSEFYKSQIAPAL